MRKITLLLFMMAGALVAQVYNPYPGKLVPNFTGTAAYEATFSATTTVSVTAATHGHGTTPYLQGCWDNATPKNLIALDAGFPTVAANGDMVITWTGSKTGACYIASGAGPIGPTGATGATGSTGANGNTVLNGSGAPDDMADGVNGDFYIDTDTACLYGPKAAGAWPGSCVSFTDVVAADGIVVTSGNVVGTDSATVPKYSIGSGAPSAACTAGRNYYLDTAAQRSYRCIATDTWGELGRTSSGSGAPASGACDAAGEVGMTYYRTDNTSAASPFYVCGQTGSGTYGWVAATMTGTANEITVTGNTLSLSNTLDVSGKTSTKPSKAGTSLPATCGVGETYIKTDATSTNQLYICTAANAWTAQGGSSTVSLDRTTVGPIYDEFIGGTGGSGAIGQLQWNFTASGGTIAQVTAEAGHPGIIKCTTSAAANGSCSFVLAGAGPFRIIPALNGITDWEFQYTFRTPDVTSEIGVRIGLTSNTTQAEPASSGLYAEYRNNTGCTTTDSDTGWNFHSDNGGSRNSDTGPSFSASTWYTLRIRSTSAGTALFSMATDTGAFSTEKAITINYTSQVTPFMQTYTCAAAAKTIEMDWFAMYMTGVAR